MQKPLAIFDLDETIIRRKSLFDVYRAYLQAENTEEKWQAILEKMNALREQKISREVINLEFYRSFLAFSKIKMKTIAQQWFNENVKSENFFNQAVVRALRIHQKNGYEIIIVSGSFYEAILPIANYLNVSSILCISLAHDNDIYTGKIIGIQTIGEGKKTALKQSGLNLKGSFGYGDHISDLPFLSLVENPVVVENDAELTKVAKLRKWKVIYEEALKQSDTEAKREQRRKS